MHKASVGNSLLHQINELISKVLLCPAFFLTTYSEKAAQCACWMKTVASLFHSITTLGIYSRFSWNNSGEEESTITAASPFLTAAETTKK